MDLYNLSMGGIDFEMNTDFRKVISVIKSITKHIQIPAVRKYIDLYYIKNGQSQKEMIEYYFKIKKKNL